MELKEAATKSELGKICNGEFVIDLTPSLKEAPCIPFPLAIDNNWKVVQPDIEVGDVVKWYEDSAEVTVGGIFGGEACLIYEQGTFIVKPLADLALIHKGSKHIETILRREPTRTTLMDVWEGPQLPPGTYKIIAEEIPSAD